MFIEVLKVVSIGINFVIALASLIKTRKRQREVDRLCKKIRE